MIGRLHSQARGLRSGPRWSIPAMQSPGSSSGLSVALDARIPRRHTAYRGRFMTSAVTNRSRKGLSGKIGNASTP